MGRGSTLSLGTALWPSAIPTIAVMCVSGPNTCIARPSLEPGGLMELHGQWATSWNLLNAQLPML